MKSFPSHEASNHFFTNTQFSGAALYVEGLTFDGCDCAHNSSFTNEQPTTQRNFFGVADTQCTSIRDENLRCRSLRRNDDDAETDVVRSPLRLVPQAVG